MCKKKTEKQYQESVVIRCKSFVNDTMEAVKGKICCCLFSPLEKFIVSTRYKYIQMKIQVKIQNYICDKNTYKSKCK